MILPPAVVIHGAAQLRAALLPGRPVLLLSGAGAGCHAGAGWWRALVDGAGQPDALDCGDAAGRALEALATGCGIVVLGPCPAWDSVAGRAGAALVLPRRPAALDLNARGAARRLDSWLQGDTACGFG